MPKKRTIEPLEVIKPSDLPKVDLGKPDIHRVEEGPKPPPPSVTTSLFEEIMLFLRSRLRNVAREESTGKMVEFKVFGSLLSILKSKIALIFIASIIVLFLFLAIFRGC